MSTELLPPPLDEKEHHATIYIINLYAIKNDSSNASEEMFQNEVREMIPDIMGERKSMNNTNISYLFGYILITNSTSR